MRQMWTGSVALLLTATPLAAQVRGTLDANLGDGMSGVAVASWFRQLHGPVTFELTGDVEGQHRLGRTDAASALGGGRLHFQSGRAGLWLGASAGGNYLGQLRRIELGAWRAIGPVSVQVQGWQTTNRYSIAGTGDTAPTFPDTLSPEPGPSSRRNQVRSTTDIGVWTHWAGGRSEIRLSSGMRFGTRGSSATGTLASSPGGKRVSSTWWSVEGTYWMMGRLGLVTSVGQSPIDPTVSGSGEQFFRIGFRASLHLRQTGSLPSVPLRSSSGAFRTRQLMNNEVEFTLLAPDARRVELMADFTGWEPVAMDRDQGRWRLRMPVPAGMHRVNVRYDGGAWKAPPDTRIILDEFGQESGELVL